MANGITTIEGVELFKAGTYKAGNMASPRKYDAGRLDRWIRNTNLKGFDTAIAWGSHPPGDLDKNLYHTNRKTGRVAPLFGGFRNFRRVDEVIKADAIVRDEWADAMGADETFRRPSVTVTGEGDNETITSVALLPLEIPPAVKDIAPLPTTQIKMSEFDKYFDPAEEGGAITRFTLTTEFEEEDVTQFSQEEADMTDGKDKATNTEDWKSLATTQATQLEEMTQKFSELAAIQTQTKDTLDKVSLQLEEQKARAEQADNAAAQAKSLQFSEMLAGANMAPFFKDRFVALEAAMRENKTVLKFSNEDTEEAIVAKFSTIVADMAKDPTGVFLPSEEGKQKTPKHPAEKGAGGEDGTVAKFSDIEGEMDSEDKEWIEHFLPEDESRARVGKQLLEQQD